jgi:hypothetical protein
LNQGPTVISITLYGEINPTPLFIRANTTYEKMEFSYSADLMTAEPAFKGNSLYIN